MLEFLHNRSAILCLADICLLLIAYRHRQKSINMCRPGGGQKAGRNLNNSYLSHLCPHAHC